jgi:hypothetical protein
MGERNVLRGDDDDDGDDNSIWCFTSNNGATGTISKSFAEHLSNIPGKL